MLHGSESGTFAVPRDWTDRAAPDAYQDANVSPRFLRFETLLLVSEIITARRPKNEVDP